MTRDNQKESASIPAGNAAVGDPAAGRAYPQPGQFTAKPVLMVMVMVMAAAWAR